MKRPNCLQSLLSGLTGAVCILLALGVVAATPESHHSFQSGWHAYENGDYQEAANIWEPLANAGNTNAQINLGFMYDYGQGVTRTPQIAARWYRAAASSGHEIAQYNLAILLMENGITSDNEDARHWMQRAAQQEYADAQYQLGLMIAADNPGQEQRTNASEWFYKAGANYLAVNDRVNAALALRALFELDSSSLLAEKLQEQLGETLEQANYASPVLPDVTAGMSVGTAWPIASGYAITNNHVVPNSDKVVLINTAGQSINATVIKRDAVNDIALISVSDPGLLPPALPLANTNARLGASVFTIGYPRIDVMGKTPKLTQGIISSTNGMRDDPTSYQISVPIQPGNSGGPLLNMQGEVVGLITSMLGTAGTGGNEAVSMPNINYALKIGIIEELLRHLPRKQAVIEELPVGTNNLETLANQIHTSVLIVMSE